MGLGSKIFVRVSVLFFGLTLVFAGISFFGSNDFKQSVAEVFGLTDLKTYSWCPDHVVDFQWMDTNISQRWKNASWPSIHNRFCKLTMEPIRDVDLTKLTFKPLLKVQSAEAKTAELQWNAESSIFQINGLPFYSASLVREILDK
jgi:hypothetical protein